MCQKIKHKKKQATNLHIQTIVSMKQLFVCIIWNNKKRESEFNIAAKTYRQKSVCVNSKAG